MRLMQLTKVNTLILKQLKDIKQNIKKTFFMATRNDVKAEIALKHNKWQHNSSDDSFYAENFTQGASSEDRESFHYPNLERWLLRSTQRYERGESKYNPFDGVNLAFVHHDAQTTGRPEIYVKQSIINYAQSVFNTTKPFVVFMFDWDLQVLSVQEIQTIFKGINTSFATHSFTDPLGKSTPITLVAKVNPSIDNGRIKIK